ncbi:vexin [Tyto alba]|uniref:vexin n=1 Tax=Tyto alba TaxID=56313 RepID=UPI001C681CD9|nr:vexin [Tyto alba]XP_032851018.2 vexin [Tyto alba]
MHQIYSCSDENLEVFTTVISSKSCSPPARRQAKNTQHILTKSVVAPSDRRPHGTEKVQPHERDLLRALCREDEARGLRSGQRGPCPAKGTAAQHVGITERESSKSYNHPLDGKSLFPPSPVARITGKAAAVTGSPAGDGTPTDLHGQRWRKTAEHDLTLPPGAEASLPLTGGSLCGTPSLLRKMWMKHKKKSEYLGATNSAFEAD